MKHLLKNTLILIILVGVTFSCSVDNTEKNITLERKAVISINKKDNSVALVDAIGDDKNNDFYYQEVSYIFVPDESMPNFETSEELESFLLNNSSHVYGTYEFKVDGEIVYRTQVVEGEKENEEYLIGGNKACTYEDIRQCAIDGIHNQNWYDMSVCILEGFGCVLSWYASCAADLCTQQ